MLLALLLHAAPASAPEAAASRLYPHASETREVLDLAGEGWLLASASSDGATTAVPDGWLREPLSLYADALGRRVRQVALPASFDSRGLNATEDMEPRVFQLERTVFVPAAWCAGDGDVVLRVGAVNHDATAFVDGRPLCTHSGEYLPVHRFKHHRHRRGSMPACICCRAFLLDPDLVMKEVVGC